MRSKWGFIFFLFYKTSCCFASWNEDFDVQSAYLFQEFPELKEQEDSLYQEFKEMRFWLLSNYLLKKQMHASSEDDKFIVRRVRESLILKKRPRQNIHELYTWELSCLLGLSEFFVPSFPIEMGDKLVIVQKIEPFVFPQKQLKQKNPPKAVLEMVSLIDYWKVHLGAYLLGLRDLVGRNIAINSRGKIRLFDTEYSFAYKNQNSRLDKRLWIGFISQAFDWPHFTMPLTQQAVEELQGFIHDLDNFADKIRTYQMYRPLTFQEEEFLVRLERVCSYPFKQGHSFSDFYALLDPVLIAQYQSLVPLIGSILDRPVGFGSVLFFLHTRGKGSRKESVLEEKMLNQWLDRYEKFSLQ